MADSTSSVLLLRLQATGDNTNLWGGYLNTALETLERGQKGYQSITVTGDFTSTWTNYSKTNEGAVATIKWAGTPGASFSHTMPAKQHSCWVWNSSGSQGTILASGGTGVAIPDGYMCHVFGDGTDYNSKSLFVNGTVRATAATGNNELTTLNQVSALIAAASVSGDGSMLVSADDTTRKFAEDIVTATANGGISVTVNNPAANENLGLALAIDLMTQGLGLEPGSDLMAFYDASAAAHRQAPIDAIRGTVKNHFNAYV